MVEASLCRMRLQEFADIGGGVLSELPLEIKAGRPQILRLHITGTPADAIGFSEISAPTTKADITTAVAVETISSAAGDNLSAGADVQKINAICIESDRLNTVELSMDPTDGTTFVLHTELLKEVFHSYSVAWGTNDKDAAGNIDVRNIADTVWVQILATKNESNGSSFKVPDGHVAMLWGGRLTRLAETVDEGVSIRIVYTDTIDGATGLAAADRLNNWLEFVVNGITGSGDGQSINIPKGQVFESGTWIQFQHSSLVNLGEPYDLTLDFLIWKK